MSAQPVGATGAGTEISPGAIAVRQRVEHLQSLIAKVQDGPQSFAGALASAMNGSGTESTASTSIYAPAGAGGGYGESEAAVAYTGLQGAGAQGGATALSSADQVEDLAGASGGQPLSGVPYASLIEQAASANGIDPSVLAGLIEQESGFNAGATSSAGAQGLTQLMPATAASLGVSEPLDAAQSIAGGARYLGGLLRQFGGNITDALAAYNAGPGAVEQYGGVPPYAETQQYVSRVLENAASYSQGGGDGEVATAVGA